jgi:Zn-dependent protease
MLGASWPLFRAFGVDVRVHWTIVVVPVIACALAANYYGHEVAAAIGLGLTFTLALYACVYTHEMAHVLAARKFGVYAPLITLSPLGGLAHMDAGAPNPRAEMVISLAGPASHLAWLVLFGPIYLLGNQIAPGELWVAGVYMVCYLQILLMVFNLLPFYPLDGGRTLRAYLATRMHANKASLWVAYVGYGGAVLLLIAGLGFLIPTAGETVSSHTRVNAVLLILIAFQNVLACQQLLTAAHFSDGPYEPVEEWKTGGGYEEPWREGLAESQKLSKTEERAERRAAEARQKEKERRDELHSRIDELLDRINEVGGVENLSASERRELDEASEFLRKETTS